MKVKVEAEVLERLVAGAGKVAKKGALPVLSHVLVELLDGVLWVRGCNLAQRVSVGSEAYSSGTDGAVLVPAKQLKTILKHEKGELALHVKKNELLISSGAALYKLQTLSADEFPGLAGEHRIPVDMDADRFVQTLAKVAAASSTDPTRYVLKSVAFEGTKDALRMVATDGRRLHVAEMESAVDLSSCQMIVPDETVSLLKAMIGSDSEDVLVLAMGKKTAWFSWTDANDDSYCVETVLVEGAYPNYSAVIPQDVPCSFTAAVNDWLISIARAATVVDGKHPTVKIQRRGDGVVLGAQTPDVGEVTVELPGGVSDAKDGAGFAVNHEYLSDAIAACAGEKVRIQFADELSAVLVVEDGFQAVVMPVRV